MGGPSPWRASAGSFGLYVLAGGVFAALLWLNTGELLAGVVVATATVLVLFPAELQAASRLSWRLGEFAGQGPGAPAPEVSWWGDQSIHWPDLGLTVEGGVHRFRIAGLVARADGRTWDVQLSRPREGARRVLEDLGAEPAFEGSGDRLPSVYPRLSGLKAGVLATFVAAVAVGLGGPIVAGGTYPLPWLGLPIAAGVLVGGLRWYGLRHARTTVRALCRGLSQGGLRVERVDRLEGLLQLTFAVGTPAGAGVVRSGAFPRGRLAVSYGDRRRRAPAAEAESAGRALARWLAAAARGAAEGVTAPPPDDLTAAQRLLFAALGTGFLAVGAFFVGVTGPWRGAVAPELLGVGIAAGILGAGLLAIGWLGREPTADGRAPRR